LDPEQRRTVEGYERVSQETLIKTRLKQKQPRIRWRADDMRKAAVVTLTLIGLMTLGMVCVHPIKAEYQGNITINADGSISPSTTPIQRTGDTYTLTSDVSGYISIKRNNTALYGNGHWVYGYIQLYSVENVTVENLIIEGGSFQYQFGIDIKAASEVSVMNNTITGFQSILVMNGVEFAGINVEGGGSNIISQNNLVDNLDGIYLYGTENNLIVGNNIKGSNFVTNNRGIFFGKASNNTVYHNDFINNIGGQAVDSDSVNVWDDGYLCNYWSDYHTKYPNAIETDDSGTFNIPYSVDAQNVDRHPLTQPFNSEFYTPKVPPKIAILSPVNQQFNESTVPLSFTVNKPVNWTGYSLDGGEPVTMAGNTTLAGLTNGFHNVTVYAEDTFGNTGASETVSFAVEVPEPFPTTIAIISGISAVVVIGAILAIYFKKRKNGSVRK
jgi:parallel beta-helix repeat protein